MRLAIGGTPLLHAILLMAGGFHNCDEADATETAKTTHPARLVCQTNKSEYVFGEPIYVTATVSLPPGSEPLSACWFVQCDGFNFELFCTGGTRRVSGLDPGGSNFRVVVKGTPAEVASGGSVTTTFEAIYALDFQPWDPEDWPGVGEMNALLYNGYIRNPGGAKLGWEQLSGCAFEAWEGRKLGVPRVDFQFRVTQFGTTRGGAKVELVGHSNCFTVVEPSDATPRDLLGYLMFAFCTTRMPDGGPFADAAHPDFRAFADGEKLLNEGKVPPWLRAQYAYTALIGSRNRRKWDDVLRWGKTVLDGYPGYPLQPEVEYDVAMALLAKADRVAAEERMRALVERVGGSRIISPVTRARRDKQTPEALAVDALYQRAVLALKKSGPRPPLGPADKEQPEQDDLEGVFNDAPGE